MKINLHIHSNCSLDGDYDINELIRRFINEGFDIISITDHNTCEAYNKIVKNKDIKIITGIEADAIANDCTYDFLCYNFALEEVSNYASLKYKTVEQRQQKIFDAMIDKCKEQKIKLKNVMSYTPSLEYAHSALIRIIDKKFLKKYNIKTQGDLYRLSTIDKTFPLYIDMHIVWPDIKELVDVVHKNNGKVFLAHPYRYNKPVTEVLNDVKDYVDGIEISNNPNNQKEVEFLYKYAKENNLLVSCGSDYHGDDNHNMDCNYLTDEMIDDITSWIN